MRATRYKPSRADMAFRNAVLDDGKPNPFEKAKLLERVSWSYLSVMAHDNERGGLANLVKTEIARRGSATAMRANRVAFLSAILSIVAILISFLK